MSLQFKKYVLLCPLFAGALFSLISVSSPDAFAQEASVARAELAPVADPSSAQVDFQADNLAHDETGQIITATGNVEMMQAGRTVKADEVVYNLKDDKVIATGNVEFIDVNGDKHYASRVEFHDSLKDGFVMGLKTFLTDGSKFKAAEGAHKGGTVTVMKNASYTPCETCSPEEEPLWQIKASEVKHDKEAHSISYKNARFEFKGVPVAYTPYFSHPDGSVKRKSGFVSPSAGYKSDLGAFVESSYYWAIAPDRDATVGMMVMTKEAPLLSGEWRQRWDNAELITNATMTYSSRHDEREGDTVVRDEEFRGSFGANGLWDINEKWRGGLNLDVVSDRQYLRQYDFDDEDVLENEAYLERFSGRDYAVIRMLTFQDLRIEEEREDQPGILPEVQASFLGEPGSMPLLGGRWSLEGSALGLIRNNDGQDMARLGVGAGWNRRLVSDFGLVTTLDAGVRGEVYNVSDRLGYQDDPTIDKDSSEGRGFGFGQAMVSYPMSKAIPNAQVVIEPLASITAAPNIDVEDDIPNEDSEDVQIDVSNLFEPNRFPGLDRVEDQSHMTYGMKTGVYAHDGSFGDVFLGQSYRLSEDDNPFTAGSGLDDQESDVVGKISAGYQDDYSLQYRFQLDNEDMSSQRHEVDASISIQNFDLSTRYLFAKGLGGTEINETREQIVNSASYKIDENWRVRGAARHDLGDEDEGLRRAVLGVDFSGQCLSWALTGERNLTSDVSGDSGTEIMFRLGLKNLGEFETSGISVRDDSNE